ncbi:MAG: hypothetical protein H7A51_00450 [Akkermansiaceae bacterium]|nr:hypothetical protein [Akkermansiaceae bacterium]
MTQFSRTTLSALGIVACIGPVSAASLYVQNFEVDDSANWTSNDSGTSDILVDYFYDYSAIGVSSAPGGSGTTGFASS